MADLADFFKYFDNTAPEKTVDPLQTFDIQIEFNIGENPLNNQNYAETGFDDRVDVVKWLGDGTFYRDIWYDKTEGLNIGMYVQSVTIPNITSSPDKGNTFFGDMPVQTGIVDMNGELTMEILNTKKSLHEYLFYPWMRECSSQFWQYATAPYVTATIYVSFQKHNSVEYVFYGCRPTQIDTLDGKQADDASTVRNITFSYDFMLIYGNDSDNYDNDINNGQSIAEESVVEEQPVVKNYSLDRNPTVTRILQSRGDDD